MCVSRRLWWDVGLKCKPILAQQMLFSRIPERDKGELYHVRSGMVCLDTLGHRAGESPGVYLCHGTGGNQVTVLALAF